MARSTTSIVLITIYFIVLLFITSLLLYFQPISSSIQSFFQQGVEKSPKTCDIYKGKWVYDPNRTKYYTNSCVVIAEGQNCRANGRPDMGYEDWRWRPDECELPRFDVKQFLRLMRNKTLAFVGDSIARNQMQSLLCMLLEEETDFKNHGYHNGSIKMKRWYFRRTSTIIARIWSSWLVDTTEESLEFAPEGFPKVHLDIPDKTLMEFLPTLDIIVLSSGHWFAKKSAYVINNTIVGGEHWWPKDAGEMKINSKDAFIISLDTVLDAIMNHPKFSGLVIVRSYSPSHYNDGAWNTGGSCGGEVQPASEVVRDGDSESMHAMQMKGFEDAVMTLKDGGSRMRMMDITEMFSYRRDGHPGPYRSPDSNKPKEGPKAQDCLHWCMPGAVDTWNEILAEIIRREYNG
ncbi:protein trichome birefringence-like 18 [Asparagus officinalis]|uniref:protein trichome birefringence-like 18 n=1 Tax=Asparagus officinalis TaxID=4686 RepID=UPI00098E23A5|nr:protein trichome birefringence-like 18 [Asparagus officinalis]